MLPRLPLILAVLCAGAGARADEPFSKGLTPEEFQAAGLGKLTAQELARLDALVRGEKAGAAARASEETAKAVAAKVTQQVRQEVQAEDRRAEQKRASSGIIERMKVILKPGTEIDYTTLDATLVPGFSGYRKGTVLTLTNGQMWAVTGDDKDWMAPTGKPVHVRIIPGSMGGFFMEIEGSGRPRVKFLGNLPGSQGQPPGS